MWLQAWALSEWTRKGVCVRPPHDKHERATANLTVDGLFRPVVLAARRYGRSRLCAPHPPDCTPRQRFVGDYIGAAAAPCKVWVAFVLPSSGAAPPNRMFVATLSTD